MGRRLIEGANVGCGPVGCTVGKTVGAGEPSLTGAFVGERVSTTTATDAAVTCMCPSKQEENKNIRTIAKRY